MFKNFWAGALGFYKVSLTESIDLARQTGFAGTDFNIREAASLADERGVGYVADLFKKAEIEPAIWNLLVDWRGDKWQEGLQELPRFAALARELGCLRTGTVCPSSNAERAFDENYAWHVERLRPFAEVLDDQGIQFGLEWNGPEHMRPDDRHAFIYTMEGMLELFDSVGTGNLGLILDIFHLISSGGSVDDMDKLSPDDIVNVHVNDVAPGLKLSEYHDLVRGFPMEKGGLPLPEFMQKLTAIGYEGPVTCEPFSRRVPGYWPHDDDAVSDPLEAAQLTAGYMAQLWRAGNLAA